MSMFNSRLEVGVFCSCSVIIVACMIKVVTTIW